ncbi:MAG: RtcB family protein, partial [Anaerolineales bacterium]|nr:RtcB family protein [Anaerolineales bacterium]
LPVTLRVALMPDAHVGYGLPIGGVAALEGALAPYMVGVDIGCRMHATIIDRSPIHLRQATNSYANLIEKHSFFGRQAPPKSQRNQHPILDDARWRDLPHELRGLQDLAAEQLGTSGGGNHFVEWTKLTVTAENALGLAQGQYIALVSHSGSRGVGYKIANHFSQLAEQVCHFLPDELRKLSYFRHDSELGQAYEVAMGLAGDFARANHEVIHARIRAELGQELVLGTLQNHHNFAWRVERPGQTPVFIHRKGATPAERDVLGIIPGSMATPGFFVRGLGDAPENVLENPSLNSAAHGSGRVLGRNQAIKTLDKQAIQRKLRQQDIKLIGGGLDEAPDAYKDSRRVMAAQADLVAAWAEFEPVVVRMDAPRGRGKI